MRLPVERVAAGEVDDLGLVPACAAAVARPPVDCRGRPRTGGGAGGNPPAMPAMSPRRDTGRPRVAGAACVLAVIHAVATFSAIFDSGSWRLCTTRLSEAASFAFSAAV